MRLFANRKELALKDQRKPTKIVLKVAWNDKISDQIL